MKAEIVSADTVSPRSEGLLAQIGRDPAFRFATPIFIAARVLTLVVALWAVRLGPVTNVFAQHPIFVQSLATRNLDAPFADFIDPWHRWDTGWYMKIAAYGYSATDGTIIFAPLYPALMALVGAPFRDTLIGGLIVSSVACYAALILLYKLAKRETGSDSAARGALIALIAFPTAFYLLAAYTEALFLALVLGTLLAARHGRWWLAGILAIFASLTRLQGWVLFFPIGWWAFIEPPRFWQTAAPWGERIRQAIPRLFAMGMGPFTTLAFTVAVAAIGLGSISDAYNNAQWGVLIRPPWVSVIDGIGRLLSRQATATEAADLLALAIIVILSLLALGVLPAPYHIYSAITLILVTMRYYTPTLLNGTLRYALDFFPIFIALGVFLARRPLWRLVWIVAELFFQVVFLLAFARWIWVA
ncbi:MAG TPA: glycosyltransferase family 39 protein [Aggregatilineales bacterium]|nr:glycosyltransferase family 39 protein [Aggregatilineales bacterium]